MNKRSKCPDCGERDLIRIAYRLPTIGGDRFYRTVRGRYVRVGDVDLRNPDPIRGEELGQGGSFIPVFSKSILKIKMKCRLQQLLMIMLACNTQHVDGQARNSSCSGN